MWHEALVGLVVGGEEVVKDAPDGDLYIEAAGAPRNPEAEGTWTAAGVPTGAAWADLSVWLAASDDLIRKVIRDSISTG